MSISNQPPISTREPNHVQKLSGAQLLIVCFPPPPIGVASVITSVTNAVVVAPTIGATAPVPNTLPTRAPDPAPRDTIPAFFIVVHPTAQAHPAMTTSQ